MTDWAIFLGRFHPLVLHFPIGLLAGAYLLTLLARRPGLARYEGAAAIMVQLGALGTVLSAILGYLLALEGGYDATVVGLHRWSGITLAALSIVLAWMVRRPVQPRAYLPLFTAATALLFWVGHLGGTLTHGSGYLVAHAPAPVRALFGAEAGTGDGSLVVEDIGGAVVLEDLIIPVLEASCTECHNPIKRKSDLDLTTADGLFTGGELGLAVSEDGALASELFRRLILPPDHEDAMPPSGRSRLVPPDVELIGWWLDEGAPREATVNALAPDDRRLRVLRERFGKPDPVASLGLRPASDRAIARANRGAYDVERIAEESPLLRARLRPGPGEDQALDVLKSVRDRVIELDLGDSAFDDEAAEQLTDFEHLQRLALHNTAVTDAAMRSVAGLPFLASLRIHGTAVTDAGVEELIDLEHLERVYAWNSGVSGGSELPPELRARLDTGVDPSRFAATPLPAPTVSLDSALFTSRATVSLGGSIPGAEIRYTLDGSAPTPASRLFTEPFAITASARVRAIAIKEGWVTSPVGEAVALRRGFAPVAIRLSAPPNPEYPGQGEITLRDGVLGSNVFRSPAWLGYRQNDLVATIDLGTAETVGEVAVSILENTASWIFPPAAIDISVSGDGATYRPVASGAYDDPGGDRAASRSLLRESFDPVQARWLRVRVRRFGVLPEWHPGSGEPAWLFVDEILIGPGDAP
jgi:uncharacterized membrane protein